MEIARVTKVFFPPFNELTVFVAAVTLYYFPVHKLISSPNALKIIKMGIKAILISPLSSTDAFLGSLILYPIVAVLLVGPLLMPFSKKDLRYTCLLIVTLFSLVSLGVSVGGYLSSRHGFISQIVLLYTFCWVFYMVLSLVFINEVDLVVSNEHTSPLIAGLTAATSVVFVYVGTNVYAMNSSTAFILAVTSTSTTVPVVIQVLFKSEQEQ